MSINIDASSATQILATNEPEELTQLRIILTQGNLMYEGSFLPREDYFQRLCTQLTGDDQALQSAAINEVMRRFEMAGVTL